VGEIRYAYSNLVGNPEEEKATLVTTCPMWEDNIKMDSKEIGYELDSCVPEQRPMAGNVSAD
jgi:hypothetical protein